MIPFVTERLTMGSWLHVKLRALIERSLEKKSRMEK
jgi:hypothetical protein